jgi:hypothetical protein
MKILVYSKITDETIADSLGLPEYSYYFAKKEFMPVLLDLGEVVEIANPINEVEAIYQQCQHDNEECIFLSFTPPHLSASNLACPSVCIFAWEFSTIPDESWNNSPSHNWKSELDKLGFAITHSEAAKSAVLKALGNDFPIAAIPSPVWDRFSALSSGTVNSGPLKLALLLDSRALALEELDPLDFSTSTNSEYYQYAVNLISQRDDEIKKLTDEFHRVEKLVQERDKQLDTANGEREYAEKVVKERDAQLEKANSERVYAESLVSERDKRLAQLAEELQTRRATITGRLNTWLISKRKN